MSTESYGPYGTGGAVMRGDTTNLADILERVLDKGVVVAGDIVVSLVDVELLSIRLRLLIASVDKAKEMGINWWESDPWLSRGADGDKPERAELSERLERLEAAVDHLATSLGSGRR